MSSLAAAQGVAASAWCDPAQDPTCPPDSGGGDPYGTTWYEDDFGGDPYGTTWYEDEVPWQGPEPTRADDASPPTTPGTGTGAPDALALVDGLEDRGEELDLDGLPRTEAAVAGAARLVLGIDALAELGAFRRAPDPAINAAIRTIREQIPADGLDDDGYRSEIQALSRDLDDLVVALGEAGPVGPRVVELRDTLVDTDLLGRLDAGETALFEPLIWVEAAADLLLRTGAEPDPGADGGPADLSAVVVLAERLSGGGASQESVASTTTTVERTTLDPERAMPATEPTDDDAATGTAVPWWLLAAGTIGVLLLAGGLFGRRRHQGSGEAAAVVDRQAPTPTGAAESQTAATTPTGQTSIEELLDVSRRLTASLDTAEVAAIALTEAERLVQGEGGLLATRDEGDGFRVLCHRPASLFDLDRIGHGSLKRVIETGRSIVQVTDDEPALVEVPMAMAAIPIVADGRVIGVILVVRVSSMPFAREDLDGLEMLAPLIGSALLSAETHGSATQLADIDPLSGLGNRRLLTADLEAGDDRPMAAIMIDIDHFKTFNDTNGHAAGDEALRRVAAVLAENVRPGDVAYRYGGEEFCVLLNDTDLDEAVAVAERLRAAVEAIDVPGAEHQPGGRVTISVGVARTLPGRHDQVVEQADTALYQAKHGGRNRVITATS